MNKSIEGMPIIEYMIEVKKESLMDKDILAIEMIEPLLTEKKIVLPLFQELFRQFS